MFIKSSHGIPENVLWFSMAGCNFVGEPPALVSKYTPSLVVQEFLGHASIA